MFTVIKNESGHGIATYEFLNNAKEAARWMSLETITAEYSVMAYNPVRVCYTFRNGEEI